MELIRCDQCGAELSKYIGNFLVIKTAQRAVRFGDPYQGELHFCCSECASKYLLEHPYNRQPR